jgi:protein-disulfide isomerase-like protein with CxxC motif
MWSQMDAQVRAEVLGEWRAILECAGVSGRSPAEVPPNWPDDVQEAQKDYAAKLDRMIVCCEVLEEVEETEGLDAETIQNARDNALFATAEHQRTLDALCAAVWRSAQQ